MLTTEVRQAKQSKATQAPCYHCGTPCLTPDILIEDKAFCCEGCRLVYEIINSNGLCDYYKLQEFPGLKNIKAVRSDKFSFLDNEPIAEQLCSFTSADLSIVTLYLPGVHCSSCMWLLEHLRRLHAGIVQSRLDFSKKEVTIHFRKQDISLRQVVELLSTIGYEPYLSLEKGDAERRSQKATHSRLYRLGVAGFCFSFIMMMSFPEYFGGAGLEQRYATIFRYLNLLLAVPVFLYCAGEFFSTAWKGLRARSLNIDAPIALAVLITFSRSVYEILTGSGPGYLDSMSGIVFFMLVGRAVQERTYRSISFHRDYKSYFPIAVSVLNNGNAESRSLHDLAPGDIVRIGSEEIIPADGLLLSGDARIDYSFVTGESEPVHISSGQKVYAGGRQIGEGITVQLQKPVAGSYLTSLWNHAAFNKEKGAESLAASSIHTLSRYFTLILFSLAAITAVYWALHDTHRLLNSVTAMLIVACPCALLLSSTFTNGALLRIFSQSGLYLRDATVIESLGRLNHIVFDKTGTLTEGTEVRAENGEVLSASEMQALHAVTSPSHHPYSKALSQYSKGFAPLQAGNWKEITGQGVTAVVDGRVIKAGSADFTGAEATEANVYARIGAAVYAFQVSPHYREGLQELMERLQKRFSTSLLSGDNEVKATTQHLRRLFGPDSRLLFRQSPMDKLHFIEHLQKGGAKVLMLGDGLNDAGALRQSEVGITLAGDVNNFTPACDAILDASCFSSLPSLIGLARAGRKIILASFTISVVYNLIGLSFAVRGELSPMIAAILMPLSTISIVLISTGATRLAAWWLRLHKRAL